MMLPPFGTGYWPVIRALTELNRCQVFSEPIERAVPAAAMLIASSNRFEDRLMQRQPGLSFMFLKRDRQQVFRARGIAFRICPTAGHNESFRLDDLAKDALRPMVITLGPAHVDSISAARAKFAALDGTLEAARTHPLDKMFGVGPGFEDQLAWRIKYARDVKHPLGRFCDRITSCSHCSCSLKLN